jgi:hypothetical protein
LNKNSFLKSKRFEVESLKRRLQALEQMKLSLDENIRQLDQAVDRERIRNGKVLAKLAMPRILEAMDERRRNMEKTSAELEEDRKLLQEQLATAAAELTAEEDAEDQRRRHAAKTAESKAALRREQNLMRRHLRRHTGAGH